MALWYYYHGDLAATPITVVAVYGASCCIAALAHPWRGGNPLPPGGGPVRARGERRWMAATGEELKPLELTVLSWGDHLYRPCVD